MSQGTSMWGCSLVWYVMAITISAGVMVSWSAPIVAYVMWSGVTSVWVIVTVTLISVRVWLWFWSAILCLSWWWSLEIDLLWCLVLEFHLVWHTGMPDGGILSGQSAAIWPYSSHSKQHTFRQWHEMWLNSCHWKDWSSSLDIILTVDEGNKVAVNYCAAWSFSTSLVAFARVWGPFL